MPNQTPKGKAPKEPQEIRLVFPEKLLHSLNVISRTFAAIALRFSRLPPKNAPRIDYLNGLGLDRNEVAEMLRTTPETVSVRLSQKRPRRGRRKKRG
jgi:hypothetical protein